MLWAFQWFLDWCEIYDMMFDGFVWFKCCPHVIVKILSISFFLSVKTLITTHKWFSSYWNVVEQTRKRIMSCNNQRSHVEVHLNSIKYSRVYVFVCMFLCVRYHLSLSSLNINFDVVGYYKMINQIYKWIFSKNKNTTSFCKIQNMLIW